MRYIAVLLTAILSLSCAANAGGIWGEPAEVAPTQTIGSTNDPLVGQANVTRQPAASSRKTNGLRSGGTVPGPPTAPASGPRTADSPKARTTGFRADGAYEIGLKHLLLLAQFRTTLMPTRSGSAIVQAALAQPC